MKIINNIFAFLFVAVAAFNGYSQELTANIDVSQKREPVSDKLFGMFMENLGNEDVGNLSDDCLWSELLDDRKFFYPVDTSSVLVPKNRKEAINQWYPVNTDVIMDTKNSYVGKQSPLIVTDDNSEKGIKQSGIAVEKDKKYTGRIVLKGTPGVAVTVSFVYGDSEDEKLSVVFDKITGSFEKYNFEFTSPVDFTAATLEITGKGSGSFAIGAVSFMPADNLYGFRPDVIALLKDLNSGIYRWGGNFISGYDWRDGVGDPDLRAPRYEYAWECLEENDIGTDEMIRFSELIGVELAMTVNTGFGDAFSAAQWVEYVNGSAETQMGAMRAKNGHPVPYDIKKWCVGNESYGWWQLGHLPLQQYIIKQNMFVDKMLAVDSTLELIGSGASIEEMTVTRCSFLENGTVIPEYGSETDWTWGILSETEGLSYISEHFYCSVNERFDLDSAKYITLDEPLEDWTRRPANRIKSKAIHYKYYRDHIPGAENIPVYLDEYAYYTNWVHPKPTLGVVIGYARGLNEMFRNTDLIKLAGFTFGTSCLSFTDTDVDYNASGLMYKLFESQFGRIPVSVKGNSPQPDPQWPVGGDQPLVNAGGDVYPLDVVAALTKDGDTLTVIVINPTEKEQQLMLNIENAKVDRKGHMWTISGASVDAVNIVNEEQQVWVNEKKVSSKSLKVMPATINVVRYKINSTL